MTFDTKASFAGLRIGNVPPKLPEGSKSRILPRRLRADHSHIGQDGAIVYANKRAEMWGAMRAWLAGGMIPDDRELLADLTGVEYGYALREGRDAIILEKKEDMKRRGLASPDLADALALTFAYPVAASDHRWQLSGKPRHQYQYDPFQQAWSGRL